MIPMITVILPDHNTVDIWPTQDDPNLLALRWEIERDSLTKYHYIKWLRAEGWMQLANGTIKIEQ